MKEFRDDAIVLRTYSSGESDRVVVLWTKEHGKVRVLAKGIRKATSKIGGTLETLAFVNVDLVKTRGDFYIARHVRHVERLLTLRSSYERISSGYAVVEAVDALPTEDIADEGIFELLSRVLITLDNKAFYPTLVPASFFFKLLAHDGSEPVVTECVNCSSPGPLVAFDAEVGGTLCAACRSGIAISPVALSLIQRILGGDLAGVLKEELPQGAGEVATLAQESIENHLGRRMKVARSTAALSPDRNDR